jgi:serine/threonine protein kinase
VTDSGHTEIQSDDDRERSRQLSLQGNKPPAEIEGYSIVRRLGTGAYGTVWLAREDRTGRMVAIKFYPQRRGLNWSMLNREVEKLAAVYTSRFIVRLLDVGWNADPPYFVMEFVENGSLGNLLARGPLSVEEAVRITREICSALIDAHGAGVLHCDLKPDNVLLDGQLHARICDFGQSRMSHEQSPALGTLFYMAPEQSDLETLPDARWDVYAVGALLYHMLTGSPPHRSDSTQRELEACPTLEDRLRAYRNLIARTGVPRGHRQVHGVDRRLAEIVDRCLALSPADRFPNAQAVRDELELRDRHRSRRPLLLLGLVGQVLLLAVMLPIFLSALRNSRDETERQITQRALESDALSARLQAAALEDELNDRLEELEAIVTGAESAELLEVALERNSDDLVSEVRQFESVDFEMRPAWIRLLDAAWQRSNESNARHQRGQDTSWFLTDRHGRQIWRREFSDRSIGRSFAFRDYFHGLGHDLPDSAETSELKPLEKPYVCVAYKSTTTGLQTVALSVPVRANDGTVIGVIARSAQLGDLQARLGRRLSASAVDRIERVIALAEIRDSAELQLLDHPLLTEALLLSYHQSGDTQSLFASLKLDDMVSDVIRQNVSSDGHIHDEIRLPVYHDPVSRRKDPGAENFSGEWIAAMAPVEGTGWMVIVQERRDQALQPVQSMWQQAIRQAMLAVLSVLLMMGVLWIAFWRFLHRAGTSLRR